MGMDQESVLSPFILFFFVGFIADIKDVQFAIFSTFLLWAMLMDWCMFLQT